MTDRVLTMEHSRAALVEYDRAKPGTDALLAAAETNEDVYAWQRREEAALALVREAFYLDTSDRNCRANCMIVGLDFVRACVAKANKETAPCPE